jgi:putative endonuclease
MAAEESACRHLERQGFTVEERNYRVPGGEIDIVARRDGLLVFVEVRSREDGSFGAPEETVGARKRLRIAAAARRYLSAAPPGSWEEARFDVIAIEGSGGRRNAALRGTSTRGGRSSDHAIGSLSNGYRLREKGCPIAAGRTPRLRPANVLR